MSDQPETSQSAAEASPPVRGWLRSRGMRRGLRVLVIGLLAYGVICLLLAFLQSKLVFIPTRDIAFVPSDIGLAYEDVAMATVDGETLHGWFVPHPAATATVLFCHGNAGNIGDRMVTIQVLHQMGYHVLIFDYRGYGRSTGAPSEQGTYLDAEAAWRYLTQTRGERPERIILAGRSLGGAVAIELATRHRPAALLAESTFTRLADVAQRVAPIIPVRLVLVYKYDSIDKVGGIECPKLFLHGRDDQLIPLELGRALYEAAAAPKLFIETPGDHGSAGFTWSPEYQDQAKAYLDEALAAAE